MALSTGRPPAGALLALVLTIAPLVRSSPPPSVASVLKNFPPPCSTLNASHYPCISENNCNGREKNVGCSLVVSIPAGVEEVVQETGLPPVPTAFEKWGLGCLSVGVVSLSGVFGAFLWPMINSPLYLHIMRTLIGLAMGSLTSTALFQLIPEGFKLKEIERTEEYLQTAVFSWLCVWVIFLIEGTTKIAFWKPNKKNIEVVLHSHQHFNGSLQPKDLEKNNLLPTVQKEQKDKEGEGRKRVAPVAWMIIFGDGLHNFIDGMSIGAGYSHSLPTGLGLTLAIICEEFPHELGDFAILVQSGMSVKRALAYNFLSACTAFAGLALGILLGQMESSNFIFAFAGGLFLYISLTHLVPEMHSTLKEELGKGRREGVVAFLLQNIGILMGSTLIFFITKYNDDITMGL